MRIVKPIWRGSKCPRLVEFVEALPRNATGKIHKPTLRKIFSTPKASETNAAAS